MLSSSLPQNHMSNNTIALPLVPAGNNKTGCWGKMQAFTRQKIFPPMQSPPAPTHPHTAPWNIMVQQRPIQTFTFTPHTINTHSCKHTPSPWEVYEPSSPKARTISQLHTPSCYRQLSVAICNLPAQWSPPPQKQILSNKGGMLSQGSAVRDQPASHSPFFSHQKRSVRASNGCFGSGASAWLRGLMSPSRPSL